MAIKRDSWRQQKIYLKPNEANEIVFSDTNPNIAQIRNLGSQNVFLGYSRITDNNNYEVKIAPDTTRKYSSPKPFNALYIYALSETTVILNTAECDEFYATDLDETTDTNLLSSHVDIDSLPSLPAGDNVIGRIIVNTLPSIPAGTNLIGKVSADGVIAHGGNAVQNPLMVGAESRTTNRTATGDGQSSRLVCDKSGRLVVKKGQVRELQDNNIITLTNSTTETTLINAVASTIHDLKGLIITNTSVTGTKVDFRDSTAGTIRLTVYVPAMSTVSLNFDQPIKQSTANNNWTAQVGTSVTSIVITALSERVL